MWHRPQPVAHAGASRQRGGRRGFRSRCRDDLSRGLRQQPLALPRRPWSARAAGRRQPYSATRALAGTARGARGLHPGQHRGTPSPLGGSARRGDARPDGRTCWHRLWPAAPGRSRAGAVGAAAGSAAARRSPGKRRETHSCKGDSMSMPLRSPATSATHSPLGICDLLAPLGLEEFIGKHYGKSVFVEHRHDRDYYGGFVTLADLDSCLLAAAASPKTILQLVPPPGSSRSALPVQASAISKDRIYDAYLSGDTVRLIGVEHYWAPVASLAASMHDAFAATIGINIFLTPPRSQAFPLHFDLVDTFLIQVAGAKRWQIWEPTYEQPMETRLSQHHLPNVTVLDESKLKLCEDSLLEAGDILYMPRGFYHKGTTEDELSLHVTATVKQVYWLDLLQRAFEVAALDHVNLREALPPGFLGDPQVRQSLSQHFAGMLQSFCELASFDQGL